MPFASRQRPWLTLTMDTQKTDTVAAVAPPPNGADLDAIAAMPLAKLQQAWLALGEGSPPMVPEHLLRMLLAYRLQELRHGGLSEKVLRKLERLARGEGREPARPASNRPGAGTRLIREWNGRTIAVIVRDDGFVWEDRHYGSLSQIAREVTGTHWSGPRFFGLSRNG